MSQGPPVLAVVGAINVDLVVAGAPLPRPGETVVGGTFSRHQGGKGGNQAVAAARASSARVVLVSAVGQDAFGAEALASLGGAGVDPSYVTPIDGAPTGVALIAVDERGENQIAVAPGANAKLDANAVTRALDSCEPAVVLVSLEVPLDAVHAAASWAKARGAAFVLNPAPADRWAPSLAPLITYLTPNASELEAMGVPSAGVVVETRGAAGARIHGAAGPRDIAAPPVRAVDATGAGDCWNGVFAAALLEGIELSEAVRRAVVAASLSVTEVGAREGMPTRAALERALA